MATRHTVATKGPSHRRMMSQRAGAKMPGLKILQKSQELHEARWWEVEPGGKVHCYLCPRHCHIGEGQGLRESRG